MLKRIFDIFFSVIALFFLCPIIACLILLVRIKLGSPVFFRQVRPGKDGKPFEMIKLRSMRDALDENGMPLPDSERITPFGRFLRASSLDELPELWNVLKGNMSIVGPRPLLMEYLPFYTENEMRRHQVRPGITGWAQINGRNTAAWDERLKMDVWYVDNKSILLDIKIIILTIANVFMRKGVEADPRSVMQDLHVERMSHEKLKG
ncbi:sugar transferase [Halopseudomonas aestusnigri]|uniref:sugar transferase n=1 Tax=Halopseudomonas aestusnigri TaxID=857252 RepID=UPI0030C74B9A